MGTAASSARRTGAIATASHERRTRVAAAPHQPRTKLAPRHDYTADDRRGDGAYAATPLSLAEDKEAT